MAERQLPKLNVAGSIPVSRSNNFSSLRKALKMCAPNVLRLHNLETRFQLIDPRKPRLYC